MPAPDNLGPLITHTRNAPHERGSPNYVDGEGVADQASPGRDPLPYNQQDAVPCHFPVGQCLTEPNFVGQCIAKRFGRVRHYGRILAVVGEVVLEGTAVTEQWRVGFEDGTFADFTRQEALEHIREYR